MKKNLLSALIFLVFHSVSFAQFDWQWLNPKPSGSDIVDMSFISEKEGFILTKNQLLKTDNAGESWEIHYPVSNAVDLDFKGKTGLIAESNGIHLSTDKGKTWKQLNIPSLIHSKIVTANILSDSEFAFSTNEYIYSSNDEVKSWLSIQLPFSLSILKTHFFNDKTALLFTTDGRILKTIDKGQNWSGSSLPGYELSVIRKVYFLNDRVGYAYRENKLIIKTTDGGATWSTIRTQLSNINGFSFIDENYGFWIGNGGYIYNTSDGAKTIKILFRPDIGVANFSLNCIYFLSKEVGFAAGDKGTILKTTDGGKTWQPYSLYLNDINLITFSSNRIGYFISSGKLYKTQDEGNTWAEKYDFNSEISQLHFFSDDKGAVVINGMIHKTEDGGTTWKTINPISSSTLGMLTFSAVHFSNESNWIVSATYNISGKYFRITKDGGQTWSSINTLADYITKLHYFDDKNGIAIRFGNLLQTSDGGVNWVLKSRIDGSYTDINGVADSVAYVSSDDKTMLRTTNKGKTWKTLTTPSNQMKSVFFVNDNIGFSAGLTGPLYYTINGGLTWNYTYLSIGNDVNCVYANSENIYCAGANGMLLKSKLVIADYGVKAPLNTEYISNVDAIISGTLFTNSSSINNIKLEYGYSEESRMVVAASEPSLAPNSSRNQTFNIKNLKSGTKYWFFISFDYNGKRQTSDTSYFTTIQEVELFMSYEGSILGSRTGKFKARVISNFKSVTDIAIEYKKDNVFIELAKAKPDSVQALQSKEIEIELTGLTPNTTYIARLKAKSNNQTFYTDPPLFTKTLPVYSLYMSQPFGYDGIVQINGFIRVPDDSIKNIVVEYDTTRFFKTPKIETISGIKGSTGTSSATIQTELSNLDPEKLYYFRLKVTIGNEVVYGPLKLYSLNEKFEIIPTDIEFPDAKTTIMKALLYSGKQSVYLTRFLYGENGVLTDSVKAVSTEEGGNYYFTTNLSAVLKNLKPDTYYKGQFKAITSSNTFLSVPFTFYNGTVLSNEPEKESNMLVYPNPANRMVRIVTPDKIIKKEILKTDGALLKTIADDADTIDITDFPTGLYILRVSTPRSVVSYKVVKQ